MVRRLLKWTLGLTLLLLVVVFVVLPMLANTEQGRTRLAALLSRALDREVEVGGLDVGFFYSSVDVSDLRIANPEGFPAGNFVEAGALELDTSFRRILDGLLEGSVRGRGLRVHIIRKDGRSNLEGFGGGEPEETEQTGKGPDLDVRLDLEDSQLVIEDLDKGEKLVVEGVGAALRLTNRKGVADVGLTLRIRSLASDTLKVTDIEVDARQAGDYLDLEKVRAALAGTGRLEGEGRMRVHGGDDWKVNLRAQEVTIDRDMAPFVASVYPMAAAAEGQMEGILDGAFVLEGKGLTWEAIKPTLAGDGKVTLRGMRLPGGSLLAQATALAGGTGAPLDLHDAGAEFRVRKGWLEFNRLSASGAQARYDLAGRVSLDGALELTMDLMPLVKQFGGGAYAKAAQYTDAIPVRIAGTTSSPQLKAPDPSKLLEGAAGKLVEEKITDLFDRNKKKN